MTRLSQALANQEFERAKILISTSYGTLGAISLCLIFLLLGSSTVLDYSQAVGGESGGHATAQIVVTTLCVFAASIVTNLIVRVQYGSQQIAASNAWQSLGSLASVAVAYAAAGLGATGYVFVVCVGATPLVISIGNTLYFFVCGKGRLFRPTFRNYRRNALLDLSQVSAGFLAINLLMAASLSTDNLVVGHAVGLEAVPEYAISARIFAFLALVTYIFSGPLWPMNVEALAGGNIQWVTRTSRLMSVISGCTALVLTAAAVLVGPRAISSWVDPTVDPSKWLMAGLGCVLVAQAFASPYFMVLNAAEVLRPQILGYSFLLLAIPLKWAVASEGRVDLVPWFGAALYLAIFAPILTYGYRMALKRSWTQAATIHNEKQ